MSILSRKTVTAVIVSVVLYFGSPVAEARQAPESFANLVENLLPTVVNISTSHVVESGRDGFPGGVPLPFPPGHPLENFNEFFEQFDNQGDGRSPHKEKLTSLGSGFIIDPTGLIVTNYHVIADAEEITITLHDETQYDAVIVGLDSKTDLAVLRVDTKGKNVKFPAVVFGDSDKARVGDWVIAIGNPFNLGGTVTAGIISARARDINAGPFDDFIQTDAAINRGNSGGPMFDAGGEVIGINTAIYSPSGGNVGIGFAVPSSMAQPIIAQLRQGKEIKRGWLGVKIQSVTREIAESLGLKEDKGALVVDVVKDSPAEKSGLQAGDIILEFDGKEIVTMRKLPRIVAETEVNKVAKVKILRKGQEKILDVEIARLKEESKETQVVLDDKKKDEDIGKSEQALGMSVVPLNKKWRERYNIEDEKGLLVLDVDSTSSAYEKGIRRGDIVVEANQLPVSSVEDIRSAAKSASDAGRKSVLLLVSRNGESIFIAVSVEEAKEESAPKR